MQDYYVDREQTEAKHQILERYLERFAHKVIRTYGSIDFVDGFSGPWEERDTQNFSDTSIGIALRILQRVAETYDDKSKAQPIRCIFNEKSPQAYARLVEFIERVRECYPLLEIHTFQGEFSDNAGRINQIATNNFMLLFVDPTGYSGFPPYALKQLTGQRNSEIIINFMRSFVTRFLCPVGDQQRDRLAALLGDDRADGLAGQALTEDQVRAELQAVLKRDLGFRFSAVSPIHNPDRNQIHFELVFATHAPAGLKVMREAEFKALTAHDQKRYDKSRDVQQDDLFGSAPEIRGPYQATRDKHLEILPDRIMDRLQRTPPNLTFDRLCADMQEQLYLKENEIKDAVVALAKRGLVEPTWEARNGRRPKGSDEIRRVK